MIELAVTLLIFIATGFGAAALLGTPLPKPLAARVALIFLLGIGIHGTLLFVAGAAGVPVTRALCTALPIAGVVVGLALRGRMAHASGAEGRPHRVAALVFSLPLLLMIVAAAVLPVRDYDGRATWIPKAKAIAVEASVSGPFFHGNRGLNLHNRYPILIPLDAAAVMLVSGDVSGEAPRWLFVMAAIAALIVLRALLVNRFDATGAWVAAGLPWLPVLWSIEGGALSAYSDLALGAFACVALYFLAGAEDVRSVRGAAWFAAFAMLTKNEGVPMAAAIAVAALLSRRVRSVRTLSELVIPAVGAYALLAFWHTLVPDAYDHHYGDMLRSGTVTMARIAAALRGMWTHAFAFSEWGGFWIAVTLAVVVALCRRRWSGLLVPLTILAVMVMTALGALTVTSWDVNELAKVTVSRLLSQVIAPAAFVIALAVDSMRNVDQREGAG